ncbi:hypothetical protein BKI52_24835 [marine bacterium AO1-C]|nr:hypothetical protein BKI52_24835 [marine bacterium AO1-C]
MKSFSNFRMQQLTHQQQSNIKGGETERDGSPSQKKKAKINPTNTGKTSGSSSSGGGCGCSGGSDRQNL